MDIEEDTEGMRALHAGIVQNVKTGHGQFSIVVAGDLGSHRILLPKVGPQLRPQFTYKLNKMVHRGRN